MQPDKWSDFDSSISVYDDFLTDQAVHLFKQNDFVLKKNLFKRSSKIILTEVFFSSFRTPPGFAPHLLAHPFMHPAMMPLYPLQYPAFPMHPQLGSLDEQQQASASQPLSTGRSGTATKDGTKAEEEDDDANKRDDEETFWWVT